MNGQLLECLPVLVVDPIGHIRPALGPLLRDAGYRVAEASCAVYALDYLRAAPAPHVAIVTAVAVMPKTKPTKMTSAGKG